MGKFDDYINGLEGKDNLNPSDIVRDLHGIYQDDVSTREAKISELEQTIAERDSAIKARDSEIQIQKAKNFDLTMQIPVDGQDKRFNNTDDPDATNVTIGDLFTKDVRRRHGI